MTQTLPATVEKLAKSKVPILIIEQTAASLSEIEKFISEQNYVTFRTSLEGESLQIADREPIGLIICEISETSREELLKKVRSLRPKALYILISSLENSSGLLKILHNIDTPYLVPKHLINGLLLPVIDAAFEKYCLSYENAAMGQLILGHHELLLRAHSKLKAQLEMSEHIHKIMLLGKPPTDIAGFQIASIISPSQEIDGDFLDFGRPLPHVFDFAMGDVMGKGLAAALVGIAVKTQINLYAASYCNLSFTKRSVWKEDIPSLKEILNHVHESIVPQLIDLEYFASILYGRFDLQKREFSFIDCGFSRPLYYRAKKRKIIPLSGNNFPLGIVIRNEYDPVKIFYEEGDLFIFHSDGVTEAASPAGELYGEKRLIELVESLAMNTPESILDAIKASVIEFGGNKALEDDITILIIKVESFNNFHKLENKPIKFTSSLSQLNAVRELVRDYCHKAPGDSIILAAEMELVMDEVFSNIIKHSYKNIPGKAIFLHAEYEKEGLSFEISDQGEIFNPAQIPHPNLFGDKDTGYGWYLIKHIADKITYFPKKADGGWNRLRIFKRYFNKEAQMELTYKVQENVIVITLNSEHLDARSIPEFKDKILAILTAKEIENVVLDLHNLQFIDSSGLGAFLSILRLLNTKGGQLKLAELKKPVRAIFELVSMHKIFEIYDGVDKAVHSFSSQKP